MGYVNIRNTLKLHQAKIYSKSTIKISEQYPKLVHVNTFGEEAAFLQKDLNLLTFCEEIALLCALLILSTENGEKTSKFLTAILRT